MAKKTKRIRTPARIMWDMIETQAHINGQTQADLAKLIGCTRATVCSDGKEPEKIPQFRLWLYFAAVGIDPIVVLMPIAQAHAEKIVKQEG